MPLQDIASSLVDEVQPSDLVPWRTCATCHALAEMSKENAAILRGLLADRRVKFSALAGALAADPDEPTIDWQSLSRHARGLCSAREVLRK